MARRGLAAAIMLGCGLVLAPAAAPGAPPAGADEGDPGAAEAIVPAQPTRVLSARDAARLRALKGVTLQWIGWDQRGVAVVTVDAAGVWRLRAEQSGPGGAAVAVEGAITEIGPDYFDLKGDVVIINTPDEGRTCEQDGTWRFAVTQNRQHYRLRRFEWCDDLTDYIDLYF